MSGAVGEADSGCLCVSDGFPERLNLMGGGRELGGW
jgi:hypothetical protein